MADDNHLTLNCVIVVVSLSFLSLQTGNVVKAIEMCVLPSYDVWNLTAKIWRFSIPNSECLSSKVNNTNEDCEITMAFCQSVNMRETCQNASVCETVASSGDTYNLAAFQPYINPFTAHDTTSQVFSVNLDSGETYAVNETATCVLSTVMTFVCNDSALWDIESSDTVLSVPGIPSVAFVPGSDSCVYTMTFDYAGACPLVPSGPSMPQLSAGSILLMIFVVSTLMYFVMGFFVNSVRGKKGHERVPHHRFWGMLPVYIMDGMLFVTCGKRRAKQSYESI